METAITIAAVIIAFATLWWRVTVSLTKLAKELPTTADLDKRIDDLRNQMTREYNHLAQKVDETSIRLDKIETQMQQIEQNHLEHITLLHTK